MQYKIKIYACTSPTPMYQIFSILAVLYANLFTRTGNQQTSGMFKKSLTLLTSISSSSRELLTEVMFSSPWFVACRAEKPVFQLLALASIVLHACYVCKNIDYFSIMPTFLLLNNVS